MQRDKKYKKEESKIFSKVNCRLTEFPTIKLHILQNIEEINISHNLIANLDSLSFHKQTSKHALSHLKKLNLSFNNLSDVDDLVPLAKTAHNL